jgi:hypothetical protein
MVAPDVWIRLAVNPGNRLDDCDCALSDLSAAVIDATRVVLRKSRR